MERETASGGVHPRRLSRRDQPGGSRPLVEGTRTMTTYPTLRRGLLAAVTVAVFALVVTLQFLSNRALQGGKSKDGDATPVGPNKWLMWGGSNSRNMVNTVERGVP